MWRCKHVADALAKHHYWELPWARRVGLKLHVALCAVCGRFHRQVMIMQDAAHHFHDHEQADDPTLRIPMPDESKRKLREKLKSAK
ncbi:MAG TPA: hypothetical protein PKE12_14400 [Kiritimatiellia bacterium]|nr:hypothetical protein [Kiritimatiellia bacterium]